MIDGQVEIETPRGEWLAFILRHGEELEAEGVAFCRKNRQDFPDEQDCVNTLKREADRWNYDLWPTGQMYQTQGDSVQMTGSRLLIRLRYLRYIILLWIRGRRSMGLVSRMSPRSTELLANADGFVYTAEFISTSALYREQVLCLASWLSIVEIWTSCQAHFVGILRRWLENAHRTYL